MKGFDALAIAAMVAARGAPLKRPLQIALSFDEEVGCMAVADLVEAMIAAPIPRAETVIVGEPSMMKVVTGHKGGCRILTTVRGYAVHSSRVDLGVCAVSVAAKLIAWHGEQMEACRAAADPDNPFLPPYTTFHCGLVKGGMASNVTAEHCEITSGIRAIPGESALDWIERYRVFIRDEIEPPMKARWPDAGVTVEIGALVPGLKPEVDGEAERLARRLTGDNGRHVVSYGTEAGQFQEVGWSTIVCGPGDIAQAHQPDEFIEVSQMEAGVGFVRRLIADLAR
jgi:acetylornithine deacetylase